MKTVGIRELKNRLSEYVREVRMGERVLVSDRGVIVAELREAGADAAGDVLPGLAALAREGHVTLASRESPPAYAKLRPAGSDASAHAVLTTERGQR